ncbi:MAG: hypothetical protein M1835_004072, partial [Candelina submexicana]
IHIPLKKFTGIIFSMKMGELDFYHANLVRNDDGSNWACDGWREFLQLVSVIQKRRNTPSYCLGLSAIKGLMGCRYEGTAIPDHELSSSAESEAAMK